MLIYRRISAHNILQGKGILFVAENDETEGVVAVEEEEEVENNLNWRNIQFLISNPDDNIGC